MARLKVRTKYQVEDDHVGIDGEDGEDGDVEEAGEMVIHLEAVETPLHSKMRQNQPQPSGTSPRLLRRVQVPLEEEGIGGEIDEEAPVGAGVPKKPWSLEVLPEQDLNEDLVAI